MLHSVHAVHWKVVLCMLNYVNIINYSIPSNSSILISLIKRFGFQNLEMKWDFEDIGMHEMEWSQLTGEAYPKPHLSPVYEGK